MKAVIRFAIALTAVAAFASPAKAQGCDPIPAGEVPLTPEICGFVWNDVNGDGIQNDDADMDSNGDQSGIDGVTVKLYEWTIDPMTGMLGWVYVGTEETSSGGFYYFDGVPDGTYKIVVSAPTVGVEPTLADQQFDDSIDSDGTNEAGSGTVGHIVLGPNGVPSTDLDFGFKSTGVVSPGTGTQGYWKNHTEEWAKSGLLANGLITVGVETFTPESAAALMGKVGKDKRISLFGQLVAAMLNVGIGNDPSCIGNYITGANNWMKVHPFATTAAVAASSPAWQAIAETHKKLDDYNNGLMCAPHRN